MKREYFLTTTKPNGKTLKPIIRMTEKSISRYANKMYTIYGDGVKVEVGYFDDNLEYHIKETWGC